MDQKAWVATFCGRDISCYYIKNTQTAHDVIERLRVKDVLFGIDCETAALPQYAHIPKAALRPSLSRVRLLQIYDGINAIVLDMFHVGVFPELVEFLETKRFIAHYATFDLSMFRSDFGVKRMNIGCTQILYKIISHAMYPVDISAASLDSLTNNILKTELPKMAQKSDWGVHDLTFEQVEYSAIDPVACLMIAESISHNLLKYGLAKTYQLSKDVMHPLVEMQLNGMDLDVTKHQKKVIQWTSELVFAKRQVEEYTGIENLTDEKIRAWLGKNLTKEELLLWPLTDTGKLSTSAHAFSEFSYLPIVKPLAVYKKLDKLTSTYGSKLLQQRSPATGKLHTHFNIAGARTGRLSSSDPNLQQYPRDEELRSHFVPAKGSVVICADYNQIEVRVAAEISQDKNMLHVYRNGLDIYSATAAKLSRKPIESIGKGSRDRQMAKALVLGLMYGLGAAKFGHYAKKGYNVDVSLEEATENIQTFRELYWGYRKWQVNQGEECSDTLFVKTLGGKARRLPKDKPYGAGINHPIQGTSAEIIFHALISLYKDFEGTPVRMVNCVHDEIIIECPEVFAADVVDLMRIRMTEAYQKMFPNGITKNLVSVGVGNSWGEAKP